MTTLSMDEERQRSGSLASTTALSHQLSLSALPDELARRLELVDQVRVQPLPAAEPAVRACRLFWFRQRHGRLRTCLWL